MQESVLQTLLWAGPGLKPSVNTDVGNVCTVSGTGTSVHVYSRDTYRAGYTAGSTCRAVYRAEYSPVGHEETRLSDMKRLACRREDSPVGEKTRLSDEERLACQMRKDSPVGGAETRLSDEGLACRMRDSPVGLMTHLITF